MAIEVCPCCGLPQPDYDILDLSPIQKKIYLYIAKHPYCEKLWIIDHVYAYAEDGGPNAANAAINVQICFANKRLAHRGLKISCTIPSQGGLYYIEVISDEPTQLTTRLQRLRRTVRASSPRP